MYLLKTIKGEPLYKDSFINALRTVGACDCNVLFIHSDVMFGSMNPDLTRRELTDSLLSIFDCLNVENIIMPVFSYSFNNGKSFDIKKSRSLMGSLSEAFRRADGVYRTVDPICSFAIKGKITEDFKNFKNTNNSLGKNSYYDFLDKQEDVKYCFFGANLADCFTYVHHVECILNVPYRFDMHFTGTITGYDGVPYCTDWSINTQCGGVKLYDKNEHFKKQLIEEKKLIWLPFASREVSCITQNNARISIIENIERDKFYFLEKPYNSADLTHEYVMKKAGKLVTHC